MRFAPFQPGEPTAWKPHLQVRAGVMQTAFSPMPRQGPLTTMSPLNSTMPTSQELKYRLHELDSTIGQKSPDKHLESATSRTIDVIKHGMDNQSALHEATDSANKMRETLRVFESKIRSLEFDLGREKGAYAFWELLMQRHSCVDGLIRAYFWNFRPAC